MAQSLLEIWTCGDYMDTFASHRWRCQRVDWDSRCQGRLQISQVMLSSHLLERKTHNDINQDCQDTYCFHGCWSQVSGSIIPMFIPPNTHVYPTVHMGGAWSDWVVSNTTYGTSVVVYTIAPIIVLASVYARVRYVFIKHVSLASEPSNL